MCAYHAEGSEFHAKNQMKKTKKRNLRRQNKNNSPHNIQAQQVEVVILALWRIETGGLIVQGHALLSCSTNDITECSMPQYATVVPYFVPYNCLPHIFRKTSEL